jgi:hypothetical protein
MFVYDQKGNNRKCVLKLKKKAGDGNDALVGISHIDILFVCVMPITEKID